MDDNDLKYLLNERVAIMVEDSISELQATQSARREIRNMLKDEIGLLEANKKVIFLENHGHN